jgi:hypothetical protein
LTANKSSLFTQSLDYSSNSNHDGIDLGQLSTNTLHFLQNMGILTAFEVFQEKGNLKCLSLVHKHAKLFSNWAIFVLLSIAIVHVQD